MSRSQTFESIVARTLVSAALWRDRRRALALQRGGDRRCHVRLVSTLFVAYALVRAAPTLVSSLGVSLLLATAAHAQPTDLTRAESLWKAHQYKEAGQLFESLVKLHPKDPDIKVRYGRLLLQRFNPGDAAALFQEALEIKERPRQEPS